MDRLGLRSWRGQPIPECAETVGADFLEHRESTELAHALETDGGGKRPSIFNLVGPILPR